MNFVVCRGSLKKDVRVINHGINQLLENCILKKVTQLFVKNQKIESIMFFLSGPIFPGRKLEIQYWVSPLDCNTHVVPLTVHDLLHNQVQSVRIMVQAKHQSPLIFGPPIEKYTYIFRRYAKITFMLSKIFYF